jgi:ribosomal protein L37AE/L43A
VPDKLGTWLQHTNEDADNRTMSRLTLLHGQNCGKSKAHTVERIDGLLTWTCTRCGSIVKQPPAPRTA